LTFDTNKPSLISIDHLSRKTADRSRWLLRDINLDIRGCDRIAISGPSGSGKSLLLRSIAMFDPLEKGKVRWQGATIELSEIPLFRSRVIYLSQRVALGEGTVEDMLQQPFELKVHSSRSFQRERIIEWLAELQLGASFLQQESRQLSGGESQIVALLRALQLEPEVLLLDEPTAGLDPEKKQCVETIINRWMTENENQRAYVWVTHEPAQVQRVGNQHFRMDEGSLKREGTQ
jgi:putative ABC transport system ATP-binding protein